MCNKAVNKCFLLFDYIPDQYKAQEIRERVVPEDPFLMVYCHDKYKTQRMCNEPVDDCLATLKFIPEWFFTSKMIKNLFIALYTGDNIICSNENPGDAIFVCHEMDICHIDLNNINLDDTNFWKGDPDTITHVRHSAWHTKFEKLKVLNFFLFRR